MNLLSFIPFSKTNCSSLTISIVFILIAQIAAPAILFSQAVVDKAILLPQMTVEQRDAIVKPAEGTVIYNTTAKKPQFYNGTAWKFFDANQDIKIGDEFAGGIIFFIDSSGKHGLVAAPADQNASAKWGIFDEAVGANGKKIGTGQSNTEKIVKKSTIPDIAARICSDLDLNGYSDWFLPSLDELTLAYRNLKVKAIGDFANNEYWSSSETDFNNAWLLDFKTGIPTENNVSKPIHVRAVRHF